MGDKAKSKYCKNVQGQYTVPNAPNLVPSKGPPVADQNYMEPGAFLPPSVKGAPQAQPYHPPAAAPPPPSKSPVKPPPPVPAKAGPPPSDNNYQPPGAFTPPSPKGGPPLAQDQNYLEPGAFAPPASKSPVKPPPPVPASAKGGPPPAQDQNYMEPGAFTPPAAKGGPPPAQEQNYQPPGEIFGTVKANAVNPPNGIDMNGSSIKGSKKIATTDFGSGYEAPADQINFGKNAPLDAKINKHNSENRALSALSALAFAPSSKKPQTAKPQKEDDDEDDQNAYEPMPDFSKINAPPPPETPSVASGKPALPAPVSARNVSSRSSKGKRNISPAPGLSTSQRNSKLSAQASSQGHTVPGHSVPRYMAEGSHHPSGSGPAHPHVPGPYHPPASAFPPPPGRPSYPPPAHHPIPATPPPLPYPHPVMPAVPRYPAQPSVKPMPEVPMMPMDGAESMYFPMAGGGYPPAPAPAFPGLPQCNHTVIGCGCKKPAGIGFKQSVYCDPHRPKPPPPPYPSSAAGKCSCTSIGFKSPHCCVHR